MHAHHALHLLYRSSSTAKVADAASSEGEQSVNVCEIAVASSNSDIVTSLVETELWLIAKRC